MSLKSKFASKIYHARLTMGFTQEQVAEAVGITLRGYQYVESGRWLPKGETMLRLMILLRISANSFCEEVGIYDVSLDERDSAHNERA